MVLLHCFLLSCLEGYWQRLITHLSLWYPNLQLPQVSLNLDQSHVVILMETSRQRYFDFEFVFFILWSRVNFLLFSSLVFLFLVPHRLYRENSIVVSLFKDSIVLNKK